MTFLLSELAAVRVLCKAPSCGAVTELPVLELPHALTDGHCSHCSRSVLDLSDGHPLAQLAGALRAVSASHTRGDIELVFGELPRQPSAALGE